VFFFLLKASGRNHREQVVASAREINSSKHCIHSSTAGINHSYRRCVSLPLQSLTLYISVIINSQNTSIVETNTNKYEIKGTVQPSQAIMNFLSSVGHKRKNGLATVHMTKFSVLSSAPRGDLTSLCVPRVSNRRRSSWATGNSTFGNHQKRMRSSCQGFLSWRTDTVIPPP